MPKHEELHKATQVQLKGKDLVRPTGFFLTLNSRGGKIPQCSMLELIQTSILSLEIQKLRLLWRAVPRGLRGHGLFHHLYLVSQYNVHSRTTAPLVIFSFLPPSFSSPSPFLHGAGLGGSGSVPGFTEHLEQFFHCS